MLVGRNFDFLRGYGLSPGGYCSLLVFAARYPSLELVSTFSLNELNVLIYVILQCWVNNLDLATYCMTFKNTVAKKFYLKSHSLYHKNVFV